MVGYSPSQAGQESLSPALPTLGWLPAHFHHQEAEAGKNQHLPKLDKFSRKLAKLY